MWECFCNIILFLSFTWLLQDYLQTWDCLIKATHLRKLKFRNQSPSVWVLSSSFYRNFMSARMELKKKNTFEPCSIRLILSAAIHPTYGGQTHDRWPALRAWISQAPVFREPKHSRPELENFSLMWRNKKGFLSLVLRCRF